MVRPIVMFGSQVLRRKCAPVREIDDEVRRLAEDLFDSMRAAEGVGLAAPQIGVLSRICVVDVSHQEPEHPPLALINPRLVAAEGSDIAEEGCLSLPDLYGEVKRPARVEIEALDLQGQLFRTGGQGFYARALQHELDHLDGKLFIDYISPLKRQLMRGALKRLKKEGEAWDQANAAG